MKKHLYTIAIIVFMLSACSSSSSSLSSSFNKAIKGDKNIVSQEIKIDNYHAINLFGSADVIYEQKSDAVPYLVVEIDKNLLDYLDIKTESNNLNIRQKSGSPISPSKFIIKTNSRELKEATIHGSGEITTVNKIKSDALSLTVKGSGDIEITHFETQSFIALVQGSGNITINGQSTSADLKVLGSGEIDAKNIATNSVAAQIDGSGDITLKGKSSTADYRIRGSGDIDGKSLIAESAICNIAGSGDIIVNAKDKLKNSISASGNIRFIGNPQIVNSIKGSGDVRAF